MLLSAGVLGGLTYDALLARCALKANVKRFMTWNVDHFRLRWEVSVARLIKTP